MDVSYTGSLELVHPGDWRRLSERAGHVFATREWLLTWWRHYGKGRRQLIGLARASGDLVAIVPLYEWWKLGVPVLRFVGHGPGDQLGPICAPTAEPVAAAAVGQAVEALSLRRFVLLAEHMGGDWRFGDVTGARRLFREASPVLRFERDSWDEFLQERSHNFRQQVRRFPRRLSQLGNVSYRLATDPERLQADLHTLFHLHRQRWGGATTPFLHAAPFHRDFATQALQQGWLRLWFLELEGRAVAALYGFRFAGAESFYQSGRDPAIQDCPVGFVLQAHALRHALEDRVHEYRFLRGDEPYKQRFATCDQGLETYGLPRGASARLLLEAAIAARGRSLGVRRILDRR